MEVETLAELWVAVAAVLAVGPAVLRGLSIVIVVVWSLRAGADAERRAHARAVLQLLTITRRVAISDAAGTRRPP